MKSSHFGLFPTLLLLLTLASACDAEYRSSGAVVTGSPTQSADEGRSPVEPTESVLPVDEPGETPRDVSTPGIEPEEVLQDTEAEAEDDALIRLQSGIPYEGAREEGVVCDGATCDAGQVCCHPVAGVHCSDGEDFCWATNGCDGPEDCGDGQVCCATEDGGYQATACADACRTDDMRVTKIEGEVCGQDSDCGAGAFCCVTHSNFGSTDFGICADQACEPCLFTGSGESCAGMDLRRSDLRQTSLRGVDLSGADLRGSDLEAARMTHCDLSGALLTDVFARGVGLVDSDLTGANFSGANLSEGALRGNDLSRANFEGADLRAAVFISENTFVGTNFRDADLTGAQFFPPGQLDSFADAIFLNTTCPDGSNSDERGGSCVGE